MSGDKTNIPEAESDIVFDVALSFAAQDREFAAGISNYLVQNGALVARFN